MAGGRIPGEEFFERTAVGLAAVLVLEPVLNLRLVLVLQLVLVLKLVLKLALELVLELVPVLPWQNWQHPQSDLASHNAQLRLV